jgi:hypothetical protein
MPAAQHSTARPNVVLVIRWTYSAISLCVCSNGIWYVHRSRTYSFNKQASKQASKQQPGYVSGDSQTDGRHSLATTGGNYSGNAGIRGKIVFVGGAQNLESHDTSNPRSTQPRYGARHTMSKAGHTVANCVRPMIYRSCNDFCFIKRLKASGDAYTKRKTLYLTRLLACCMRKSFWKKPPLGSRHAPRESNQMKSNQINKAKQTMGSRRGLEHECCMEMKADTSIDRNVASLCQSSEEKKIEAKLVLVFVLGY